MAHASELVPSSELGAGGAWSRSGVEQLRYTSPVGRVTMAVGLVALAACSPFGNQPTPQDGGQDGAPTTPARDEPDGGAFGDAAITDAAIGVDAEAGPRGDGVRCQSESVLVSCQPGDACCLVWQNGIDHCIPATTSPTCPGEDPSRTSVVACDDPHDCGAGEACCGLFQAGPVIFFEARCLAPTACTGSDKKRLCRSNADCVCQMSGRSQDTAGPYSACNAF